MKKNLTLKITLLLFIAIFAVIIFCFCKVEPHHLSSKEAFLGNLYRGNLFAFIFNEEKAKTYLDKAVAKTNNAEVECDLAEIYAKENDITNAGPAYTSAAMNGSYRCEAYLIKLSYPDEKAAFQFFKKLSDERNYASAQFIVGRRYIEGLGVMKNSNAGITYFEKAVSQGHWGARVYLAGIYIKGELLPQDIEKANKLMDVIN